MHSLMSWTVDPDLAMQSMLEAGMLHNKPMRSVCEGLTDAEGKPVQRGTWACLQAFLTKRQEGDPKYALRPNDVKNINTPKAGFHLMDYIPLGDTPMHFACRNLRLCHARGLSLSSIGKLYALLRAGANPLVRNDKGELPSDYAPEPVRLLLEEGGDDPYRCQWLLRTRLGQPWRLHILQATRMYRVTQWRQARDANTDAALAHQAAREGRPLELAKRLRLGRLAGAVH